MLQSEKERSTHCMIRRRAILALTILFGGIILILAYSGIESSRKNMLRLLRQEGESLMQALVTSARNNLASSTIVEEAATERLVDVSTLLGALLNESANDIDSLGDWQNRYRLERIDLVDGSCRISASSAREMPWAIRFPVIRIMLAVLDSVVTGKPINGRTHDRCRRRFRRMITLISHCAPNAGDAAIGKGKEAD